MPTTKPETVLHGKILEALRHRGAFAEKLHGGPHQRTGMPDIIVCYRGWFIGLEVKLPGEERTLTPIQAQILREIASAGGRALVVTSVETAMGVLDAFDIIATTGGHLHV